MKTTCNASIALLTMGIWSVLSLASVLAVSSPTELLQSPLASVTMYGRFEVITAFIGPLTVFLSSLSLMRTSLMWLEIASRSKFLRPVLGTNFHQTNFILTAYHSVLVLLLSSCLIIAFAWPKDQPRINLRIILAFACVPISGIVLVTFRLGAVRLFQVLFEASQAVHNQRSSIPQPEIMMDSNNSNDTKRSSDRIQSLKPNDGTTAVILRKSSETLNYPNSPILRLESTDGRLPSRGPSDFTLPVSAQKEHISRAEKWRRHAHIIYETSFFGYFYYHFWNYMSHYIYFPRAYLWLERLSNNLRNFNRSLFLEFSLLISLFKSSLGLILCD